MPLTSKGSAAALIRSLRESLLQRRPCQCPHARSVGDDAEQSVLIEEQDGNKTIERNVRAKDSIDL